MFGAAQLGPCRAPRGRQKSCSSRPPADTTAVPAKPQQPTGLICETSTDLPAPPAPITAGAAVCGAVGLLTELPARPKDAAEVTSSPEGADAAWHPLTPQPLTESPDLLQHQSEAQRRRGKSHTCPDPARVRNCCCHSRHACRTADFLF